MAPQVPRRRRRRFVKSSTLLWCLPLLALLSVGTHHFFVAHHHQDALDLAAGWLTPQRDGPPIIEGAHVEMLAGNGRKDRTRQAMNVLFVVSDDLRPQLSTYGRGAVTPNLDKLAARGLTFDRAYAQTTVCNPSRVSFMTGRKPDVTQGASKTCQAPPQLTGVCARP